MTIACPIVVPDSDTPGRHFGGSLLPSSDPQILRPLSGARGTLQVKPLLEIESYGLFIEHEVPVYEGGVMRQVKAQSLIASHPNGYSCRNLAERMIKAWLTPSEDLIALALDQFDYILSCGGLGVARGSMEHFIRPEQAKPEQGAAHKLRADS